MLIFTPVLLLGVLGWVALYRRKDPYLPLIVAVSGINILLYSLWGDPYGGWAFGSRYMVPTYAMLAIGVGGLLSEKKFRVYFLLAFLILFVYSVGINTLGALTSNSNPPIAEIPESRRGLERLSYDRNLQFLADSGTKSFVYPYLFAGWISPERYFAMVTLLIMMVSSLPVVRLIQDEGKRNHA
jgi:hypothetical protein